MPVGNLTKTLFLIIVLICRYWQTDIAHIFKPIGQVQPRLLVPMRLGDPDLDALVTELRGHLPKGRVPDGLVPELGDRLAWAVPGVPNPSRRSGRKSLLWCVT